MAIRQTVVAMTVSGVLLLISTAVEAKGCIKGAAVGAVAGHVAGHHGVVGAAAGCVIGHHMANKDANGSQPRAPTGAAVPMTPQQPPSAPAPGLQQL